MRSFLLPAAIIIAVAVPARGTDSLFFNGGGYCIEVIVGHDRSPVIAQILFASPKAKDWAKLSAAQIRVEKFHIPRRILVMHFTNPGNSEFPPSFTLSAKKNTGTLQINGNRIMGKFDWST